MRSCFPRDWPSTASWWAAIAGRKHYSNRASSGVFSARRTPVREQTPLQCICLPCRRSSSLSDGLYHRLWETTQVCRVPSRSHTWRFHRSGRGCQMVPSPWERRSFLRGMRQGGAVARRMSLGNQVWVGQNGATSSTCSSSSLTLHSVCASRLTGGNAYLHRARGQLCASASVPRGPSVREKYCWQWEDSREANRSTWASPNRLQISRIVSGWSRHSPGKVSCRESASAARLSSPGMWTARSDLSRVWLQRRRWRASCDMRRVRIPPIRLIYDTAAVLSVRTNTCLPNSSGGTAARPDALPTALGSWRAKAVEAPSRARGCLPVACSAPARAGGICCDNNMPGHLF